MKIKSLLIAVILSSVLISGCSVMDMAYEPVEEVVQVQQPDGTYIPKTNVWYVPKYESQLDTVGNVAKVVDPTPISDIVFGILGVVYAAGASLYTRVKLRKAKTKELTYAKSLVVHGDEMIKLLDEIKASPEMKGKLLERFEEIQKKAGIWEEIKPFLDPVAEMEFLARQKFGK